MGGPAFADRTLSHVAIAVTGHRSISPSDHLRNAVRDALTSLCAGLSTNADATVITLLAEGADTLVAQEAVALGLSLTALLPEPLSVCRDAFPDASRPLFDDLISRASAVLAPAQRLPAPMCYADAAERMLESSDVLLAVWDGIPGAGAVGGSADVVRMAHAMGKPVQTVRALRSSREQAHAGTFRRQSRPF